LRLHCAAALVLQLLGADDCVYIVSKAIVLYLHISVH
jgi:hypothetical protein